MSIWLLHIQNNLWAVIKYIIFKIRLWVYLCMTIWKKYELSGIFTIALNTSLPLKDEWPAKCNFKIFFFSQASNITPFPYISFMQHRNNWNNLLPFFSLDQLHLNLRSYSFIPEKTPALDLYNMPNLNSMNSVVPLQLAGLMKQRKSQYCIHSHA